MAEPLLWPETLTVRGVAWARLAEDDPRWGDRRGDPYVAGYTDGTYTVTMQVSAAQLAHEPPADVLATVLEQARVTAEDRMERDPMRKAHA